MVNTRGVQGCSLYIDRCEIDKALTKPLKGIF